VGGDSFTILAWVRLCCLCDRDRVHTKKFWHISTNWLISIISSKPWLANILSRKINSSDQYPLKPFGYVKSSILIDPIMNRPDQWETVISRNFQKKTFQFFENIPYVTFYIPQNFIHYTLFTTSADKRNFQTRCDKSHTNSFCQIQFDLYVPWDLKRQLN
jgi:hypothetical protein